MEPDNRPDPDRLLQQIKAEEESHAKGKLKIFLGYSAGVGKTYKMLQAAHSRINQGVDVVIGYVDTHGRVETDALLEGLPLVPRKEIEYRGIAISEMDLDAIIERHPQLVLVDEFAHTNPPNFRNKKRYEDVKDLLDAGIDVYTTLNIQHIESFKDIVIQMTGITVRETVPDRVIDDANEIELVDLPPVELIQRFQEGKVYMGNQAAHALENFFTQGNLIGLRELALRRAAQRVDKEIQDFSVANTIHPNWPVSGRLLACVSGNVTMGERVVRTARRLADELKTPWTAVFVDTSAIDWKARNEREQAEKTLALAKSLGAETVILPGKAIAESLLAYAVKNNVARMVVGKPIRSRWQELVFGSNTEEIIRLSGWIEISIVTEENPPETKPSKFLFFVGKGYTPYLGSLLLVAAITVLNTFLKLVFEPASLAMFYLFAIVISAVAWGKGPALFSTFTSAAAFDILFITPSGIFGFTPEDLGLLGIFLLVGLVVSLIVTREHTQLDYLRIQASQLASLYEFIRDLAAAADVDAIARIIVDNVKRVFKWNSIVFSPQEEKLVVRFASPGINMDEKEMSIVLWVYNHGSIAGFQSDTLSSTDKLFLPFTTERQVVGVIGIQPTSQSHPEEIKQDRFMQIFIDQAAWAIERAQLR
jgi:two-component system sensor histidine kinase KdpD